MNEEEEEAPLEDPRIHRNLAWERHVVRLEEQHVADANWRAAQRGARSNAQTVTKKPSFELHAYPKWLHEKLH